MKKFIAMTVLSLVASVGQASVSCTVNSDQGKQETLITRDLGSSHLILISRDFKSAREIEFKEFDTKAKWLAINGQTLLSVSEAEPGNVGITAGTIHFAPGVKNALPMDAMSIGSVEREKQFLALMLPQKHLSITCAYLNN